MAWFWLLIVAAINIIKIILHKHRKGLDDPTELENLFIKNNFTSERGIQLTIYNNDFHGAVENGTIKNLLILIPGLMSSNIEDQEKYVKKYCESLKNNFYNYKQYTVLCFDWKPIEKTHEELVKAAQWKGRDLGRFINKFFSKKVVKNIHLVAHDLGSVLAQTVGENVSKRRIDFIFSLDQRTSTYIEKSALLLKPSSAEMVETIYSENNILPEVQRNFYILPKNEDKKELLIYEIFAEVIASNGDSYKGVTCSNSEDYLTNKCTDNEKVAMWSNEFIENTKNAKTGKFYLSRA